MSLVEIVDNCRTDKNTTHSYLDLYEELLNKKKYTATNVLEIGICYGGSIKLWYDYFQNANVYGLDVMHINDVWTEIRDKERIKLYTSTDAYNLEFFIPNLYNNDVKYDFIIDDGPHTLESMKFFVSMYSQLLTDDGILILEDIQSIDWIPILQNCVPNNLKQFVKVYDLRKKKNRYDDIVLVIDKSSNK